MTEMLLYKKRNHICGLGLFHLCVHTHNKGRTRKERLALKAESVGFMDFYCTKEILPHHHLWTSAHRRFGVIGTFLRRESVCVYYAAGDRAQVKLGAFGNMGWNKNYHRDSGWMPSRLLTVN